MVDFILASTLVATFYGGFKLGNKFKTLKEAAQAALEQFK